MSNGKKWLDGNKVHRDFYRGYHFHVGGKKRKRTGGWWFRSKVKNNKYGDFEMTHLSMRRPMAIEIWGWD